MRTTLAVHVGNAGHRAGTLHHETAGGRQHSVFTYDPAWVAAPHGFPISPAMPFSRGRFFTTKGDGEHATPFPGPIADTCPDAWGRAILNRDRRGAGRPVSDIDYLTGVDDAARIGALRFATEDDRFLRQAQAGRPIVPPLLSLGDLMRASDALEDHTETAGDIRRLVGAGSSWVVRDPSARSSTLMADCRSPNSPASTTTCRSSGPKRRPWPWPAGSGSTPRLHVS